MKVSVCIKTSYLTARIREMVMALGYTIGESNGSPIQFSEVSKEVGGVSVEEMRDIRQDLINKLYDMR